MSLLHSTRLYITLPWLYFTLLDSTLLYLGSTSLYLTLNNSTIALLHSTWLNITVVYITLLDSIELYHGSTSFYYTLYKSSMALLHSTLVFWISLSEIVPLLYSRKFSRGRNFHDFRDQTPACENLFPWKFFPPKFSCWQWVEHCLRAADPVNQQKIDLFCRRSIEQTAEIFRDPWSTRCNCK